MSTTEDRSDPALQKIDEKGMQESYLVLSEDERKQGYVRPLRRTYIHLKCKTATTMGRAIAETYARNPEFYSGTYCAYCQRHFPVGAGGEFVWDEGDYTTKVGT